jgi:hypothetical protein
MPLLIGEQEALCVCPQWHQISLKTLLDGNQEKLVTADPRLGSPLWDRSASGDLSRSAFELLLIAINNVDSTQKVVH